MIELSCPKCNTDLDIDDGFRGSVCRCFKCGTLFIVPEEAGGRKAEMLSRPERPEAPGMATDGTYELAPFRTPSGRTVRMDRLDLSNVPVVQERKRRPAVRISTTAVVIAAMLAIVAAVVYGMLTFFAGPPRPTAEQVHREQFRITENPYLLTEPNFMSLPVGQRNVFMFDGSGVMQDYFDQVKLAAIHAVSTLRPDQQVQVVVWNEREPITYPGRLMPASQVSLEELFRQMQQVYAGGAVSAQQAFMQALGSRPDQVFIVARRAPPESELTMIGQMVENVGVPLVVIQIDHEDPALKQIAENSGGSFIPLAGARLQRWYEEYLNRSDQASSPSGGGDGQRAAPGP